LPNPVFFRHQWNRDRHLQWFGMSLLIRDFQTASPSNLFRPLCFEAFKSQALYIAAGHLVIGFLIALVYKAAKGNNV
jgi:hypothetical protein